MLTFDSLPQARVVRKGAQQFAPPPRPRSEEPGAVREAARNAAALLIGLWPLTAVVLLCTGFIIVMAGSVGGP